MQMRASRSTQEASFVWQVVGDPPVAGKIAYTKDLASQLVLPQINMVGAEAGNSYSARFMHSYIEVQDSP